MRSIIKPQIKKMSARYKVVCDGECLISSKIIHSSLLLWRYSSLRKLNNISQNEKNRRSGEKDNCIFDIYKNSVMPHGCHIYATSSDMAMATIYAYPTSQHILPH